MKILIIIATLITLFSCKEQEVKKVFVASGTESSQGLSIETPEAYYTFCEENNIEINLQNETSLSLVKEYIKYVMSFFKYTKDSEQYGVNDKWVLLSPDNPKGDCEDYVLTLRQLLIDRGFERYNVRPMVVKKGDLIGHMVLYIQVGMGFFYIIDYDQIYNPDEYPYEKYSILDISEQYWLRVN